METGKRVGIGQHGDRCLKRSAGVWLECAAVRWPAGMTITSHVYYYGKARRFRRMGGPVVVVKTYPFFPSVG